MLDEMFWVEREVKRFIDVEYPPSQAGTDQSRTSHEDDYVFPPVKPFIKMKHLSNHIQAKFVRPERLGDDCKPAGCLWLGCGNAWYRYSIVTQRGSHRYESTFTLDTSQLLVLDTESKLIDFEGKYHSMKYGGYSRMGGGSCIAWDRVRQENPEMCGVYIPRPMMFFQTTTAWTQNYSICSAALWSDACVTHKTRERKIDQSRDYNQVGKSMSEYGW